ncbi:MAG TPA: Smr/MutS family protein [Gemmatimonadaceae bacterium]|nr:Smr/MutS family protein [Gemmatimonadaceae bacterium]
MNAHALDVLEFARVSAFVAGNALSESAAERVRALTPGNDAAWIDREHSRIAAVRALRGSEGGWGPDVVPVLGQAVARLRVAEASWTAAEAHVIHQLLSSAARTRNTLRDSRRPAAAVAVLAAIIDRVFVEPSIERAIDRAIAEDATVRDDASPALRRLRRELREAEQNVVRILERVIAKLESHHQVGDASVTVRNGRYVIPIRRDARATVGGIVHDTSATGATLFVEPPAGVEAANRIRELEIDVQREIDRILLELTDAARPHADALAESHDALTELDALHARARYADEYVCAPVVFARRQDTLRVINGRHPLLLANGNTVVPFDLELAGDERTMLVSGPNTGGKTVLLKAVGLFHAMAQAGFPIPVGPGTQLPLVDDIFADVGDEQSIEASLSTFSAHLRNLREILVSATPESLVLIDELGSGTDPAEGAALGAAILEDLTARGTRCVATTHLGALKDLPLTAPGVVNASLQFDEAALRPTYRLQQGIPGRSYGLSIARRLELPEAVLRRAEERVPEQERALSALVAALEQREAELAVRAETLAADEAQTREHGRRVAERERAVRTRERELERESRTEARRYLLQARADVERTIAELRRATDAERNEQERAARRALEREADAHADALASLSDDAPAASGPASETVAIGTVVEVATLGGRTGRVVDVRGDDAVVAVGAVKLTLPLGSLRASSRPLPAPTETVALAGDMPEHDARPEVDVRGVRAAEVDELVMAAIDSAVRADLRTLRIIHGKGTGVLRERVADMLGKDVRVKSFRLGAWNEGGAGVTVVELA